jgi:hypothetical protein
MLLLSCNKSLFVFLAFIRISSQRFNIFEVVTVRSIIGRQISSVMMHS